MTHISMRFLLVVVSSDVVGISAIDRLKRLLTENEDLLCVEWDVKRRSVTLMC